MTDQETFNAAFAEYVDACNLTDRKPVHSYLARINAHKRAARAAHTLAKHEQIGPDGVSLWANHSASHYGRAGHYTKLYRALQRRGMPDVW